MADGDELSSCIQHKEAGKPVEIVYPAEGTPLIVGPNAMFKTAPNPNAARLFQNCMHLARRPAAARRLRRASIPRTRRPWRSPGVKSLAEIKLMKDDAGGGREARPRRSRRGMRKIFRV